MHSAIKSLEHHTVEKLKGNDEHFFFSTLSFEQMQLMYQWLSCHLEITPKKSIIIDAEKAPFWLLNLAAGRKIEAIKEIRARLESTNCDEYNIPLQPGLMNTKDFIEAIQEAIVEEFPTAEIIDINK